MIKSKNKIKSSKKMIKNVSAPKALCNITYYLIDKNSFIR